MQGMSGGVFLAMRSHNEGVARGQLVREGNHQGGPGQDG
jgi:hypothetical protein